MLLLRTPCTVPSLCKKFCFLCTLFLNAATRYCSLRLVQSNSVVTLRWRCDLLAISRAAAVVLAAAVVFTAAAVLAAAVVFTVAVVSVAGVFYRC
jgi:hypothetical protein